MQRTRQPANAAAHLNSYSRLLMGGATGCSAMLPKCAMPMTMGCRVSPITNRPSGDCVRPHRCAVAAHHGDGEVAHAAE
jgi:hypothetical protein